MEAVSSSSRSVPGQAGQGERDSRDLLLQATSELMVEKGTFDVSLHAIARRAGVTAPLIKYYFGNKDGLLVALAERDTGRSLVQLEELVEMKLDPAAKLRFHVRGIVQTYARFPYLNSLLDNLLKDDASEAAERLKASFVRPLIEAQRRIIEEGIAQGKFRPIDPSMAYFLIIGACQYIFTTRVASRILANGGEIKAASGEYAAFVSDTVLRALQPDPS